jgi:hypothetical protein
MDVNLIVVTAKTGTKEIHVRRPKILGKAKGSGIVIPHPAVSDRHCLLFEHAGLLMLQDLNSAQGTVVAGRKIIMAPLPPGTEFHVGPLIFRAEYSFAGSLESLPKTIFADELPEPPVAESNGQAAHAVPTPATPVATTAAPTPPPSAQEPTSFFGFGISESMPVVQMSRQPVPPIPAEPSSIEKNPFSQLHPVETPQVPVAAIAPPPLPVETPSSFGNFPADDEETGEVLQDGDSELAIPGFTIDQTPLPTPAKPLEEPEQKKPSGSILDFFSKRPTRRRGLTHLEPDSVGPLDGANPSAALARQPADAAKKIPAPAKGGWSDQVPDVSTIGPPQTGEPQDGMPAKPESVDEDLSKFFKNLE